MSAPIKPLPPKPGRVTPRTVINDTSPLDDEIDRVFGEAVVLMPMRIQGGGYRASVPDDSRPQVISRGIYDQTRGAVEGTGGGMSHTQATVDTTLSIRVEPVLQCALTKGDRVTFPERGETHEVVFIYNDPGGRPDVHLVRVTDA